MKGKKNEVKSRGQKKSFCCAFTNFHKQKGQLTKNLQHQSPKERGKVQRGRGGGEKTRLHKDWKQKVQQKAPDATPRDLKSKLG